MIPVVSLFQGSSTKELNRLQRLQNKAAKLIFKAKKYDHASSLLRQLHWLPVAKRIEFKTLAFVYKCFTDNAPSCLTDYIKKMNRLPYPSKVFNNKLEKSFCVWSNHSKKLLTTCATYSITHILVHSYVISPSFNKF